MGRFTLHINIGKNSYIEIIVAEHPWKKGFAPMVWATAGILGAMLLFIHPARNVTDPFKNDQERGW